MRSNGRGLTLLAVTKCLFFAAPLSFSALACRAQIAPSQVAEAQLPAETLLIYDARLDILTSEAEQRKEYEDTVAQAKAQMSRNKNVIVRYPAKFPGKIQGSDFQITIARSRGKLYWSSTAGHRRDTFIYDGKHSYYYDGASHRMFVSAGFRLNNGMQLLLPGRGIENFAIGRHLVASSPSRLEGDVYCGMCLSSGDPMYLPGIIELVPDGSVTVKSAVSYNKLKKHHEYQFSGYSTSDGITLPSHIVERLYNQASRQIQDEIYEETKYDLVSSSSTAPPQNMFDPNLLVTRGTDVKHAPEFVQWDSGDGKEIAFAVKPGKSIEDQAGIENFQISKATQRAESGKIDPRNYAGLTLLLILLCAIGWRIVSTIKGSRSK